MAVKSKNQDSVPTEEGENVTEEPWVSPDILLARSGAPVEFGKNLDEASQEELIDA